MIDHEELLQNPRSWYYEFSTVMTMSLILNYALFFMIHHIQHSLLISYRSLSSDDKRNTSLYFLQFFTSTIMLLFICIRMWGILINTVPDIQNVVTEDLIKIMMLFVIVFVISTYLFEMIIRGLKINVDLIIHHISTIAIITVGYYSLHSALNPMYMHLFSILILYAILEPGMYIGLYVYKIFRHAKTVYYCAILNLVTKLFLYIWFCKDWYVITIEKKCTDDGFHRLMELKDMVSSNEDWCVVYQVMLLPMNTLFLAFGVKTSYILYKLSEKLKN